MAVYDLHFDTIEPQNNETFQTSPFLKLRNWPNNHFIKDCSQQRANPILEGSITNEVRQQIIYTCCLHRLPISIGLSFSEGCVTDHIANWKLVATDQLILDSIKHYHIEFEGGCRHLQADEPKQITFSLGENRSLMGRPQNSSPKEL